MLLPCHLTDLQSTGASTGPAAGSKPKGRKDDYLGVPNVFGLLKEIAAAGEGMIEDVVPVRSCAKLP